MSWLFIFVLFSFPLFAETNLAAIEVQAKKDVDRFTFDSPYIISTEELEKNSLGLITESLTKVPGLVSAQNGGPGGRVSFFLRGTEARHVSFLLDGLKLNDTSNTDRQFDAAFMTSPFIRSIIVHKGPQAVLYGSDALGGMVEMQSRRGENSPDTRFILNTGSFGTIDASLSSDWQKPKNNGTLTASRFHTDGISRLNEKRYNATEQDASDITQVTSSSEHRWAKKWQTDLLASYLHGKAEQDGFASDNSHDYSLNDQYILQQRTNYDLKAQNAIALRTGLNRHQRVNESLVSNSEFFSGNMFQNEVIHRLDSVHYSVLSGIATEHESAQTIDMDKQFDLNSLFVQSSFSKKLFKFHAGFRAENHSKYGRFNTGSTGIGYSDFSAQYSQGYKAPSLYQLYGPDSFGAPVGNPDLVPETNHSLEVSWKKTVGYYEGGITLFQNNLDNQFTYSFSQGYLNQQRYIAEGIETFGNFSTTQTKTSLSYTHQNFRDEKFPILRRPYNMAILGFSYFPKETVELNFMGRWFSSRKDFGTTRITKLNGYEVVDLSVRKSWVNDAFALQLKNIFDREYEDLFGFSVMPRSIFAHYEHTF